MKFSIREKLKAIIDWIRKFLEKKFHYESGDVPYYFTIAVAIILFVIALRGFIELTDDMWENDLDPYDAAVTEFIASFRTDWLTGVFKFVTRLGERIAYIIITVAVAAVLWFRKKNWKLTLQTAADLVLASLTNILLKRAIGRDRPDDEHLVDVATLSFPSGHSMSAMAFYGFLLYLTIRFIQGPAKILLAVLLLLIILGVGVSRIYLGVHYPSDVAAGFIGGFIWVNLSIVIFQVSDLLRKKRRHRTG